MTSDEGNGFVPLVAGEPRTFVIDEVTATDKQQLVLTVIYYSQVQALAALTKFSRGSDWGPQCVGMGQN